MPTATVIVGVMDGRGPLPAEKERHAWYAGRRRILETVLDELSLPADARILDAGCGAGGNLAMLRQYGRAEGVDSDPATTRAASAHELEVAAGHAESLAHPDSSFDLVCYLDVLEHVEDDIAVLREARRVARDGALLLVTVPAFPSLWSSHDAAAGHHRRYTHARLLRAGRAAGWEPRRVHAFNSLLLPLVGARRLTERLAGEVAPRSDLTRVPRVAGPVVGLALLAEAWLLRRGVRPPVGLSLLAVFA